MLFSSLTFLYLFLPCAVALYYLTPNRLKNYILLADSLVFYAWGEPDGLFLIAGEIMSGYLAGRLLERYTKKRSRKIILILSLSSDLLLLVYFKFVSTILPIGISFYTFQLISYVVDVYRREVSAQKNLFLLALYVAMFPQLVAGPIIRYQDMEGQLLERRHSSQKIWSGSSRFVTGLGKKVLIANSLGELCTTFRVSSDLSVSYYWLYAVAFTLYIYFDFSGYSDMAVGLGEIFGFQFPENFRYPYEAKSITEFWRRWHRTLGDWFRDYVYIPLGGNRVPEKIWVRNILLVWLLTGLWHGVSWNFIIWGMLFAVLLMLEKQSGIETCKRMGWWSHVYVMFFILLSFVIFHAVDLQQAAEDLLRMFGLSGLPIISREALYYWNSYKVLLVFSCVGATSLPKRFLEKCSLAAGYRLCRLEIQFVGLVGLLIVITAYLIDESFQPFLYFRF